MKPKMLWRDFPTIHHTRLKVMIDETKPVEIYKNLHTGLWSVRQRGKVVCHTDYICLKDVAFKVSEAGRQRVLREKKKNVHAVVRGMLANPREANAIEDKGNKWVKASYNPYKAPTFVDKDTDAPLTEAMMVDMMIAHNSTPLIALGTK